MALPEDALHDDDQRALALVVPREVKVLVVDGAPSPVRYRDEAYFVESALASPASPVRPTLVDAEAFPREDLARYDVVFLLNVRSAAAKAADLARFVEGGGGLFISVGDQVEPEEWTRDLGALLPMPLHVVKTAAERGAAGARAARRADAAWDHPAYTQVWRGTYGGYSVRTERWRYTEWGGGASGVELYDYENDPNEEKNLAAVPEFQSIVTEMSGLLKRGKWAFSTASTSSLSGVSPRQRTRQGIL